MARLLQLAARGFALAWSAAAAGVAPHQTWYMVDSPAVVCTGAKPPAPGVVNITVPLDGIRAANLQNAPHIFTLYRTTKLAAQVTFQVVDAKGKFVVAQNTVSLRGFSRRLEAASAEEPSGEEDSPRELRGTGRGGGFGGGHGHGGSYSSLGGSAKSRGYQGSPRRRSQSSTAARRRIAGGTSSGESSSSRLSSLRRRGSPGSPRLSAVGVGGSRFQNTHGQPYGFTQPQTMHQHYPGGYTKTGYGYSGVNSYTPAAGGGTGNVIMAAMGGAALGVGASYLYSRWNSYDSCYSGASWSGSCSSCYAQYSQQACQYGPPRVSAHRDDLMSTGFWPDDWTSPLTVTIYGVQGRDFGASLLCSSERGASSSRPIPKGGDLFFTLTKVDELSGRAPPSLNNSAMNWSIFWPVVIGAVCSFICCCYPACRAKMERDKEHAEMSEDECFDTGRQPVVMGVPANMVIPEDESTYRPGGRHGGFMETAAPNGMPWRTYCKAHRVEADPTTGMLTGAWGECLVWAKAYEVKNPNWADDPEYSRDGPCGQVLEAVADAAGFDEVEMEEAHEFSGLLIVQKAAERLEKACEAAVASGTPLPLINRVVSAE